MREHTSAALSVVLLLLAPGPAAPADEAPVLRLLRFPTSERADAARERLGAGESFATVAQEYVEGQESPRFLGRVGMDELSAGLRAIAEPLAEGEVGPVLRGPRGFLIIARDVAPARYLEALPDPDLRTGAEPQVADRIRELRAAVEATPTSAEAWGVLAMSLDIHDFKVESLSCYPQAAELDPGDFRWPYLAALAAQKVGDPGATTWFERALTVGGRYSPLLVRHGELAFQRGDIETAGKRFRQALEIEPGMAFARLGLAQVLMARGELDAAAAELTEALKTQPDLREARALLAEIYRRQGQADEAARLGANLATRYAETPMPDPLVRDVLEAEGVSGHWLDIRSRRAAGRGDYDLAVALSERAIQAKPHGVFYNNYAVALLGAGRRDDAIAALEESLGVDPEFALTYLNLASLLRGGGDSAAATEGLRRGLERLPDEPGLLRELAWTLATAPDLEPGQAEESLQVANRLLEQVGDPDAAMLDAVAAAHAAAGHFDEAVAFAERARERAEADGQPERAAAVDERMDMYRRGQRETTTRKQLWPSRFVER